MKVTRIEDQFYVDGKHVATIHGRSEVYVYMVDKDGFERVVARFKYMSPKSKAVRWVKFMLTKMTSVEIIERLQDRQNVIYPSQLAESLGFVDPIKAKMQAFK